MLSRASDEAGNGKVFQDTKQEIYCVYKCVNEISCYCMNTLETVKESLDRILKIYLTQSCQSTTALTDTGICKCLEAAVKLPMDCSTITTLTHAATHNTNNGDNDENSSNNNNSGISNTLLNVGYLYTAPKCAIDKVLELATYKELYLDTNRPSMSIERNKNNNKKKRNKENTKNYRCVYEINTRVALSNAAYIYVIIAECQVSRDTEQVKHNFHLYLG